VYEVLRNLVREAREKAKLTQRDLAGALKRDRSYVWKSEQGERRMDVVEVIRWLRACGSEPLDLFRQMIIEERRGPHQ